MGVLDKIKNALFEVEYVEVEDKPKKEKLFKHKEEKEEKENKPIAKKIVLPGKKEEKVEEIQEEELKDEDFEIRPKDEVIKEVFSDDFNVMDDDVVTPPVALPEEIVEEINAPVPEERVEEPVPEPYPVEQQPISMSVQGQSPIGPAYPESAYANKDYVREYDSSKEKVNNTISNIYNDYHVKTRESRPYGMDPSYQVSIKAYGTESKDDKGYFKPSPIISPIYGILDKNYKKEDVVSKKEIHITSSYAKTNMNVDDIRNKAYGRRTTEEVAEEPAPVKRPIEDVFEVDHSEDENLLVDLTDEKKPEVKEITVGDAMEYYHDLGLEYNVDYVDASNKNAPQPKSDDLEEDIKDTIDNTTEEEPVIERTMEIPQEEVTSPPTTPVVEEKKEEPVVEEKVEEKKEEEVKEETSSTLDDDDNLFDLNDSMYKDEDN